MHYMRPVGIALSSQQNLHQHTQSETDGDDGAGFLEEVSWRKLPVCIVGIRIVRVEDSLPCISRDIEVFHPILLATVQCPERRS
jgi:hypothetical protein